MPAVCLLAALLAGADPRPEGATLPTVRHGDMEATLRVCLAERGPAPGLGAASGW